MPSIASFVAVSRLAAGVVAGAMLLVAAEPLRSAESVTTSSLLGQMVNTARLGNFPAPAYDTIQFSSHDHRSRVPGGPDWFANSDGFGREPIPNFERVLQPPDDTGAGRYLICDVRQPGAIVRTWSAAIEGTLHVYLDDAPQPLFEGPAADFLRRGLASMVASAGMDRDLYERTYCQRDACYFPIPFQRRCRIEWSGNVQRIHFYEVQIRRYAAGTQVESFSPAALQAARLQIRRTADILADPLHRWPLRSRHKAVPVAADIPAGKQAILWSAERQAAVEQLVLKIDAADLGSALRQTLLKITFDDHADAQVQAPVGDFFGAGPGINPFNSVPFTVEPDGTMTCRFVMPFERSCRIVLENRGAQPVRAAGSVLPLDWSWKQQDSMHFRARWRVDHELIANRGERAQDLPFLTAGGRGVYVGTAVMLLNPNPVPTSAGNWWGEGDEKIFVDDDVTPSTFGTGSEDYFNYSWSSPDIFLFPYCGQPRNDGPANRGFVVNHRWHVMDALPFQQRIAFYMELFSHEPTPHFSYARIAYHYGRPGIIDDFRRISDEDLRSLELPESWEPAARGAARGSTFFPAEQLVQQNDDTVLLPGRLWQGGQLLVWSPREDAWQLHLKLKIPRTGNYRVALTVAQMPSGAELTALGNDRPLKFRSPDGTITTGTDFRVQLRTFSTDVLKLEQGDWTLTLACPPGKHGGSAKSARPQIGIDFVWLQPQ